MSSIHFAATAATTGGNATLSGRKSGANFSRRSDGKPHGRHGRSIAYHVADVVKGPCRGDWPCRRDQFERREGKGASQAQDIVSPSLDRNDSVD